MTSEQFEELKAIQDAYLEMANKRQEEAFAHPNHKKLDANGNGKVDAHDFKLLRKKKPEQADPVKQACDIAKQNGGNMTGSIDKIEKIKKGLSKHPKVQAALQLANESFELTESSWPAKGESMKTTATMTKNKDGSTTTAFPDGTWKIESKGYKAEKKPTNLVYTHAKSDVAYQNLVYKKGGTDNYQLNKEGVEEVVESERSEKYKTIVSSLDRMRAKATANAELQKLQKQNKEHKKLPEEVEELEELSKATLGSYVKKASDDKADFAFQQGQLAGNQTKNKVAIQTSIDKEKKRRAGISKAVGKLTKEEVELEEADEIFAKVPKSKRFVYGHKVSFHAHGKDIVGHVSSSNPTHAKVSVRNPEKGDPHNWNVPHKYLTMVHDSNKARAELTKEEVELEEAKKEPMEIYHPSYSSAVQHAKAHAEKQGYEISDDDWHSNVTMGPGKPSGGKTTRHVIPLHKDGKLSKKGLAIQVYDRQTDKKPYELNSYIN